MPTELRLPELGENVEKGDVVRVLVQPGDSVAMDQPVLELETDKATIEVPSSVAGKVSDVKVKAGDKVKVGQVVLVVDGDGAAAEPSSSEAAERPDTAAAQPESASAREEAKGEPPPEQEKLVAVAETPEAEGRPSAPSAKTSAKAAEVVDISAGRSGQPSRGEGATGRVEAAAAHAPAREGGGLELAPPVPAAPSVRRFARELGVEIGRIPGTGPGGRIGPDDVKQHVKGLVAGPVGRAAGGAYGAPLPDFAKWGEIDVKPMSNIRRKTAEQLTLSWQAPHVTQHDRADVSGFEAFRQAYGPRVERAGGKLTMTAILIKVAGSALRRFPQFASSVDLANEAVIYKKYCHVGVAVDTPNGLLVPVVRDADTKTITEIAVDLATVSQKARDRKLSLDDMSGSVFTISNLGGIGGTAFTPIVNYPEVAILGVSRASKEPVWSSSTALAAGGEFVPRDMLPLSLSYDHRVIDGADAARFLRFVAEALEQPLTMVL